MSQMDIVVCARGHVVTCDPVISVATAAQTSTFTPAPGQVCAPFTFRFSQASNFNLTDSIATTAFTGRSTLGFVCAPFSFRFYQASNAQCVMSVASAASSSPFPSGVYEQVSRPLANVRETVVSTQDHICVSGDSVLPFAYQPPTEVYRNPGSVLEVVDNLKSLFWWGSGDAYDYVYIEYRTEPTVANPRPVWHDILESMTWALANNEGLVCPTLSWASGIEYDETQTLTYELVIAFDHALQNVVLRKNVGALLSYTLLPEETLDVDQTYFWAVRSVDNIGDYSDYSIPSFFNTYSSYPPNVRAIGGTLRFCIPLVDYHWDWNVGNLPEGLYNYQVGRMRIVQNEISGVQLITEAPGRFVIDHDAENPPEIVHVEYDERNYKLKFDVRLTDSGFDTYDLVSVAYADQRDKIIGEDESGYHIDGFDWHSVPLVEIQGRRKRLASNPYISSSSTLSWLHNQNMRDGKTYRYDVKVMSGSVETSQDFVWAYRTYTNDLVTPSDWVVGSFDAADPVFFRKPSSAIFVDESMSTIKPPYFGKANPVGIVMNKTYFVWSGSALAWDFVLGTEVDGEFVPNMSTIQSHLSQPCARVLPESFFDYGYTNVLLDLVDIEDCYYELYENEIDKISRCIPNRDFYWMARAKDEFDTSSWSVVQRSRDFNIHHFEWDIRNDTLFAASDYIVLKVSVKKSVEPRKFEYPHFSWLNVSNPQIEKYLSQIRYFEEELARATVGAQKYYSSYIGYLRKRILDVRNYVLDSLIEDGYFNDTENFDGFVQANLHAEDRFSELDVHNDYLANIRELDDLYGDEYRWSPTLYTWEMDRRNMAYQSQSGKPLRRYEYVGKACETQSYSKCYRQTGEAHSCPWIGRTDLGFCPGFVAEVETAVQRQEINVTNLGLPPNITSDPEAFNEWARVNNLGQHLIDSAAASETVEVIGIGFDPGSCPMAAPFFGTGGPCINYKKVDKHHHKHYCEICGQKRYPQYLGMEVDRTAIALQNQYSDLNPSCFAIVEIDHGNEQSNIGESIAQVGQSRNPHMRFVGLKLNKQQLPGELNSDVLDLTNNSGIAKPYFIYDTGENLPPPGEALPAGSMWGNWYPITQSGESDAQVIEVI